MTSFHQNFSEVNKKAGGNPQLTLDHVSPATLLLEKRRQMLEVQQALDAQKEEYARKEALFRRREQQLRKKDLELQENLCQFNKFLKDKSDKRQQYLKKADNERKLKVARQKDIELKQKELTNLIDTCNKLEKEFKSHEKYEKYLETIKQKSYQDFPEIEYILKRYNLLNDARISLEHKEESSAKQLELLRKQITDYTNEQNNKYLDLNNEKQRLQRQFEFAVNESNQFETHLSKILNTNSNRNRELGQLINSVRNLYTRCKLYLKNIHHFQDLDIEFLENGQQNNQNASNTQNTKDTTEIESNNESNQAPVHNETELLQLEISQKIEIVGHYVKDCKDIVQQYQASKQTPSNQSNPNNSTNVDNKSASKQKS